jgi:hypothetical protein
MRCALLLFFFLSVSPWCAGAAQGKLSKKEHRRLAGGYYHSLTVNDLGVPNPDVAIGNPLKGLMPSPQYSRPPYNANMPNSLEFYYIGRCSYATIVSGHECFALSLTVFRVHMRLQVSNKSWLETPMSLVLCVLSIGRL